MPQYHPMRRKALLTTETLISIALLLVIAALAADAAFEYHHTRDHYVYRQAAAWAAEAQLQRCRLGAVVDSRPPAELVPESISLDTRLEPGDGQWRDFNLVTVTATATTASGRKVTEQISGYIPALVMP